ncbi:hypothetical protein L1987_52143 [Smallanthus sonchifolius]|uniref:Uncharacterized protein n=1 Tax=Smallanthus sonchifolius TaxID=185202 RepID=A0ACB9ESA0_9ASTR|nr:hypothetical protein L1987_87450 [Smallanthus sonchifolius]KAI3761722.1 hypothetical protein L1987_52143 [Smallanthus sonchifolius]
MAWAHALALTLEGFTFIHYGIAFLCFLIIFLYRFLEFHFLNDAFTLFRGSPVTLTYNSASEIYHGVASNCRLLHGRYMATPWLSSPHVQTAFLNFNGRPPAVDYTRKLFHASDGGTFAMDWLKSCDDFPTSGIVVTVLGDSTYEDDITPIVIVIPGLTSDSSSAYLKHLAFSTAKRGWNIVVCNHGGLGGISVTVKYLGEYGEDIPIAGAVAICSPWDLLLVRSSLGFKNDASGCDIGSRFICRRTVQKFYDRALTVGLQEYAQLHCSSAQYVTKVLIPLLCISALDDPVCTWEAIPWDECRWVRAVNEFLGVLHNSPFMHKQKNTPHSVEESCVDQGPYVNVSNGMVAAISNHDPLTSDDSSKVDDVVVQEHVLTTPNNNNIKALDLLKWLSQVFPQSRRSTWMLATLPLLGVALHFFVKKFNKFLLPKLFK